MKVFTYYSQIDSLNDPDLITVWRESWSKPGWEPIVLNQQSAEMADPAMTLRFMRSPLQKSCPGNPAQYTMAAMLRWVPMTTVTEPCLHVDWDVMCNGLKPEQITIHDPIPTFLAGSTCPCAVAASPRGWKLFASSLEVAPFLPRFNATDLLRDSCDQYACSILPPELYFIQEGMPCKLYLEQDGWKDAPMIHFPTRLTPYPRSRSIRRLGVTCST